YILSEVPFSFFLMGAVWMSLRMADEGRHRDAWGMGLFAGIGMVIRPQMLISAAFLGVFWILRRKSMPKIRLVHLLQSFVPVAVMLAISSGLLHHNTKRYGLISENGSFNLVFGRCHNSKIHSTPDGKGHGRVHFRPPSFLQVKNHEARAARKRIPPRVALNPAIDDELRYPGYIGDSKKHMEYVRECIRRTGFSGQMAYSVTNASLLWRHNIPWPDSGRSQWRTISRWWTRAHRNVLAVPALIGLLALGLGRRRIKLGLVAVHVLAMLVVAAVFFGSIRVRTPYDYLIMILAFEVYGLGLWLLYQAGRRGWTRLRSSSRKR
ncbi:MAG: hypothetical protein K0V04_11770, partial [Deltaproteobacteria bacterium]|nr:hypothetical protein [Deltaproteobacteria bacterium]